MNIENVTVSEIGKNLFHLTGTIYDKERKTQEEIGKIIKSSIRPNIAESKGYLEMYYGEYRQ